MCKHYCGCFPSLLWSGRMRNKTGIQTIRNIGVAGNGGVFPVFLGVVAMEEGYIKKTHSGKSVKRKAGNPGSWKPPNGWMFHVWIFLGKILRPRDPARENWTKHTLQLSQSVQAAVTKCHRWSGL